MKLRNITWSSLLLGGAMLLSVTGAAGAQESAKPGTGKPAKNARSQGGAPQETIKVHGHWTITIRNSDGTVAREHRFENALALHLGAGPLLATLLSGDAVSGQWTVGLNTSPSTGCNPNGAPCLIVENASTIAANSRDLVVTSPATGPDVGKTIITGSVRVASDASIIVVGTFLTTCAANVPASACVTSTGAGAGPGFTQKVLATPIPVVQGQLLDVKVVISFS